MINSIYPQKTIQPMTTNHNLCNRGNAMINAVLVITIIGLIAIIALQAWDLQRYIEI